MYVVYDADTGWTDEGMRFSCVEEAFEWINNAVDENNYLIREEA
jgi:hypothetical protein